MSLLARLGSLAVLLLAVPAAEAQFAFSIGRSSDRGIDQGYGLAQDRQDNVYIIGRFESVVDFDPGPGDVSISSGRGVALYLASYDPAAQLRWVVPLRGADVAGGVAVDPAGHVYIAGGFRAPLDLDPNGSGQILTPRADSRDVFAASYTSDGTLRWGFSVATDSDSSVESDFAMDIATGSGGAVYLAGVTDGTADFDPSTSDADLPIVSSGGFVAAYDTSGAYRWAYRVPHSRSPRVSSPGNTGKLGLATSREGRLFVTGAFAGDGEIQHADGSRVLRASGFDPDQPNAALFRDAYVTVYTPEGAHVRAWHWGGDETDAYGHAAAIDVLGGVVVTGTFERGSPAPSDFDPGPGMVPLESMGRTDAFVVTFDSTGGYQSATALGGPSTDGSGDVTIDPNGASIHVTGFFRGTADLAGQTFTSEGASDAFYAVFSPIALSARSVRAFGTPGDDRGNAVSVSDGTLGERRFFTGLLSGAVELEPATDTTQAVVVEGGAPVVGLDETNRVLVTSEDPVRLESVRLAQNVCSSLSLDASAMPFVSSPLVSIVDGNDIRLDVRLRNPDHRAQTVRVQWNDRGVGLPSRRGTAAEQRITLAANDTTTVRFWWDTTGRAWNELGHPVVGSQGVEVLLLSDDRADTLSTRRESLTFAPPPLVLVHGLWSSAATWASYDDMASLAHIGWRDRTYAVGDERVPGIMDTGSSVGARTDQSIAVNAVEMATYVRGVRSRENACQVDVVAHSMGGLIAREYVQNLMPDTNAPAPEVRTLLQLGTPNQGSPCADNLLTVGPYSSDPTSDEFAMNLYQLSTGYLAGFNARITDARGVPIHLFAAEPYSFTCSSLRSGDQVVPLRSALAIGAPAPSFTSTLVDPNTVHTAMPGSSVAFEDFVVPILSGIGLDEPDGSKGRADVASAPPETADDLQQRLAEAVPLAPGETRSLPVDVDGSALLAVVSAEPSVGVSLVDPSGTVRADRPASDPTASALFRSLSVDAPEAGRWTLRLTNTGASSTEAMTSAHVRGAAARLEASALTVADGEVIVRADLALPAGEALPATLEARAVDIDAESIRFALRDDGAAPDAVAGDGRYTGGVAVAPADHALLVRAAPDPADRAGDLFAHTAFDARPEAFADLSLSSSATSDADSVVVEFTLANAGPAHASNGLLDLATEHTRLISIRRADGEACTVDDSRARCRFDGLASGAQTSLRVVLLPAADRADTLRAGLRAFNLDPDRSANTSAVAISDPIGTNLDTQTAPDRLALSVPAPNPATGRFSVAYALPTSTTVRLEVRDVLGRHVATLAAGARPAGRHAVPFDAARLAPGLYLIRLIANGETATSRLTVAR